MGEGRWGRGVLQVYPKQTLGMSWFWQMEWKKESKVMCQVACALQREAQYLFCTASTDTYILRVLTYIYIWLYITMGTAPLSDSAPHTAPGRCFILPIFMLFSTHLCMHSTNIDGANCMLGGRLSTEDTSGCAEPASFVGYWVWIQSLVLLLTCHGSWLGLQLAVTPGE
jgi:hypothetical protein